MPIMDRVKKLDIAPLDDSAATGDSAKTSERNASRLIESGIDLSTRITVESP